MDAARPLIEFCLAISLKTAASSAMLAHSLSQGRLYAIT